MDTLPASDTPDHPHFRCGRHLLGQSVDYLVALAPLLMWAIFVYGWRVLTVACLSVASCLLFGWLTRFLLHRPDTLGDGTEAVLGVILTCLYPVSVPLWMPVLGGLFATAVVRELFGGTGRNLLQPAAATFVLLRWCFPTLTRGYPLPFVYLSPLAVQPAAEYAESPLLLLQSGAFASYSVADLFVGSCPGAIGELSVLLILGGGIYLFFRRVLNPEAPLTYLLTVALLAFFFPQTTLSSDAMSLRFMANELLSGGLVFGAVYLASDGTAAPLLPPGRGIYGIGCGLLTVLFRYYGTTGEGVLYAILCMNLLTGLINRLTLPRRFGGGKSGGKLTLRSLWESAVTDRLAFCQPPLWMRGIPLYIVSGLLAVLALSGFILLVI